MAKIAFLGLRQMGAPMAARLLRPRADGLEPDAGPRQAVSGRRRHRGEIASGGGRRRCVCDHESPRIEKEPAKWRSTCFCSAARISTSEAAMRRSHTKECRAMKDLGLSLRLSLRRAKTACAEPTPANSPDRGSRK